MSTEMHDNLPGAVVALARAQTRVAELEAELATVKAERDAWKKDIEGLTPGGSEFVNDPKRCAEYIRSTTQWPKQIIEARKERDAAIARCRELTQLLNRERLMDFKHIQKQVHKTARDKGWWTNPADIGRMVCNIHAEVSEAWEEFRNNRMATYFEDAKKPCGFWSEMADVVIRVMDLAEANGIDLEHEILIKNDYNKTREQRHGGKVC